MARCAPPLLKSPRILMPAHELLDVPRIIPGARAANSAAFHENLVEATNI